MNVQAQIKEYISSQPEPKCRSSRQGEFHPKPLTEPYLKLSLHTALVTQSYILKDCPVIKHCWVT